MSIRTEPTPSSPGQLPEPVTEGPGYGTRAVGMGEWVSGRWTTLEQDGILFGRTNGTGPGEMEICSAALAESAVVGCRIRSAEALASTKEDRGAGETRMRHALLICRQVLDVFSSLLLAADAPNGCA